MVLTVTVIRKAKMMCIVVSQSKTSSRSWSPLAVALATPVQYNNSSKAIASVNLIIITPPTTTRIIDTRHHDRHRQWLLPPPTMPLTTWKAPVRTPMFNWSRRPLKRQIIITMIRIGLFLFFLPVDINGCKCPVLVIVRCSQERLKNTLRFPSLISLFWNIR